MNKFFHPFVCLFSLIVLFSCEPGRAENGDLLFGVNEGGGNGGGGTAINKILTKVTGPDDENGGTYTINYNYTGSLLTGVSTSNNSYSETITYSGANISKIVRIQDDNGERETITNDFVYNGSTLTKINQKTEASGSVITQQTTVFSYDSVGNIAKIVTSTNDAGTPPTVLFTVTSDFTYSGANISTWDNAFSTNSVPVITIKSVFSDYDNYKNAYNTLPKSYCLYAVHEDTDTIGIYGLSKNNFKTVIANGQSQQIVYQYDADNYTKSMSSNGVTVQFEYKTL